MLLWRNLIHVVACFSSYSVHTNILFYLFSSSFSRFFIFFYLLFFLLGNIKNFCHFHTPLSQRRAHSIVACARHSCLLSILLCAQVFYSVLLTEEIICLKISVILQPCFLQVHPVATKTVLPLLDDTSIISYNFPFRS